MNLPLLFGVALVGVLGAVGLGLWAVSPYLLASYLVGLVVLVFFAQRRARPPQRPQGRTCECCTSTVFDPVEVR